MEYVLAEAAISPERQRFLDFVLSKEGLPYLWGGKGLKWQRVKGEIVGLDCSGLVTAGIYHATEGRVDWRAQGNCNKLYEYTKKIDFDKNKPRILPKGLKKGDLAFYGHGTNMLSHVMIYMGDRKVYGAGNGGNSDIDTVEKALKRGAMVVFRDTHMYRPDFRAWTQLPL